MTTPQEIFLEASRLGLGIELAGDGFLDVFPADRVTPDFLVAVRRHKLEIISVLEARRRASFVHLARQVIQGEFDGCERGVRIALMNDLNRYNKHRLCLRAFSMLYLKDLGVVP
jgi:hypothetical protein